MANTICNENSTVAAQAFADALAAGGERARAALAARVLPKYACSGDQMDAMLDALMDLPELKSVDTVTKWAGRGLA